LFCNVLSYHHITNHLCKNQLRQHLFLLLLSRKLKDASRPSLHLKSWEQMEFAAKREMSEVCANLKSLGVWKKSIL